jgi:hypothetical protein
MTLPPERVHAIYDCAQVEQDNLDLHAALADLLKACERNIGPLREGDLTDARRRAMQVLTRTSVPLHGVQ